MGKPAKDPRPVPAVPEYRLACDGLSRAATAVLEAFGRCGGRGTVKPTADLWRALDALEAAQSRYLLTA